MLIGRKDGHEFLKHFTFPLYILLVKPCSNQRTVASEEMKLVILVNPSLVILWITIYLVSLSFHSCREEYFYWKWAFYLYDLYGHALTQKPLG